MTFLNVLGMVICVLVPFFVAGVLAGIALCSHITNSYNPLNDFADWALRRYY